MRIYNSATHKKEEFQPIESGKVRMYVCGPTVYDNIHIGNARTFISFDVIRRWLIASGYEVTFAQNLTDVDDKIIKRANEQGRTAAEVATEFSDKFIGVMRAANVLDPDVRPRATKEIGPMIAMIKTLIEQGHAYAADNGDVYFAVRSDPNYGQVSGRNIDDLMVGARIEENEDKIDPLDFALWKAAKPGEPSWPSPWGEGRPGWHTECAAMVHRYLGTPIDIHGGGSDLAFPHHENECAQATCAWHQGFSNTWMHTGMLLVDGEKMSKSLGNFFTLAEVLEQHSAAALRLLMLQTSYRSPLDFSWERLEGAENSLTRIAGTVENLRWAANHATADADAAAAEAFAAKAAETRATFKECMDDDFNTAGAMGAVFGFVTECNQYLEQAGDAADKAAALAAADTLAELQTRSDALKKTIADTEATRAALGQSDAEQLKIEHRIELAEGLTATCATLLQDLDKAKAAKADAEEKQHAYAEAQAALDELETAHIAMQRQLNANRAGLLAQELVDGQPCPVCGAVHHPHPAALPQDHVTEKALEDHEKTLTAQRRKTADASRAAGDAAAHAAELRATLLREADAFFARRGARYEGKPAAELTPDELWDTLLAQQKSLADGLAGLQADHKKFKQQADKARALADQLDNLNRQLAGLEKQAFAATRKSANAKAGHAAAAARVQQMQETMPKREDPDTLPKLQAALSRLRADRAAAMAARDAAVHRLHTNRAALAGLDKTMRQSAAARDKRAMWDNLSKTINGNLAGKVKLPFEQYVQAFYFDGVVEAANLRFTRMTDGQYRLLRRKSEAVGGKTALDLDVFDAYTGKTRPVGSLSGGESFMAALCLALGISDTIQQNAGGVTIETLFIDEGFGSLDADALEKAVDTLAGLAGGDKLIGVISHVEALQDRLTRQVRVTKTRAGSKAEIVVE